MQRHDTLLIACPDPETRKYLRQALDQRFNLLETSNPQQTRLLLEQNLDCIAAVVLVADGDSGPEVQRLRGSDASQRVGGIPVIVITREDTQELPNVYFRYGAADVIPVNYDPYAMLRRIETIVQLYLHKQHLTSVVQEQADILRRSNDAMVEALSSLIEYRSVESGHHIQRIRRFTAILMEEVMHRCPEYRLTAEQVRIIASASALHDVGKIAIPDAILLKPAPLTKAEWEVMKTHPVTGCQILDTMGELADQEYLRFAYNICRCHHERWDGSGYPQGLSGDKIPICAQVVGLADAFEALTSKRVYKDAYSFQEAVNMILKGECGAFSTQLLECFKNVVPKFEALTLEGDAPQQKASDHSLPIPETRNSNMERLAAKYYALVHYAGAFLVEVDLDRELFHVVYNPYPELAQLDNIQTLDQLIRLLLDHILVPQERQRMEQLLYVDAHEFVQEDRRRSTHRFHYREADGAYGGAFEMTFLRIGTPGRRSLAVLFRKLQKEEGAPEQVYSSVAESTYICRNDQHFTLVQLGADAVALGGYTLEDLQSKFHGRLAEMIYPQDRDMVRQEFTRQLQNSTLVQLEHRVVLKNGSVIWVVNRSHLVVSSDGQEYLYSFLADITETRTVCEELRYRLERYRTILTQTQNVLFVWDVEKDYVDFSDTWWSLFPFTPQDQNFGQNLATSSHIHPDDIPLLLDRITSLRRGSAQETVDLRIAQGRGSYLWCRVRANASRGDDGVLREVMGIITSIEEEKGIEHRLKDQAVRDSLTKLLNKEAGRTQAEDYLAHYPQGVSCAMLIIDLDNFKQVNDQYGHLFGDAVLTQVARDIQEHFRDQDIVSRIGGDEFLVLVRGTADRRLLESRCRKLLGTLCSDLRGPYKRLNLSCSIGIALSPEHGTRYYELFNHADQALYQAKAAGKNDLAFYSEGSGFLPAQTISYTAVNTHIDSDENPGLAEDTIVRQLFRHLYSAKDVESAIQEVISSLGTQMNVSRVYIFENSDDNTYCSNTFEWCNAGVMPEKQNLQHVSYLTDIPEHESNFDEQGVFYCPDVTTLPQAAYDIVAPQGIKSMLHCAIRQDGVFRGYIGFDECVSLRLWTKEEIRLLTYFSEILSMFLLQYREQEKMKIQAEDLRTILDNQNAWTYIIDPDTWQLEYINEKARAILTDARVGEKCHRCLLHRDTPCEGCPAVEIKTKRADRSILLDEKYHSEILAEAAMVHWHGQEKCLMTCRALPPRK